MTMPLNIISIKRTKSLGNVYNYEHGDSNKAIRVMNGDDIKTISKIKLKQTCHL